VTVDHLIASALRGESAPWPARTEAAFETVVLDTAENHGVAALLAIAPGVFSWPSRVRTALTNVLRIEAAAETIRRQELRQLLDELGAAGTRPLLLKGGHIAYVHYPSPWLRPRLDTDLIIAPGERLRADEVVRSLGYRPATHFAGELVSHQFQYERQNRYGFVDHVDLHWKVANPHVFADVFSFKELESQAGAIDVLGPNARGPSNAHALILACVHRVAHHHSSDRLIWLYDIHLLARAIGPEDREAFVDLVLGKRLSAVCADGLAQAEACFGTAGPKRWLDRLQTASSKTEPTAAFLGTGRTKLDVLRSDLRALPDWRSKLRIVREHLFPPVAYIRKAYSLSNPASVPFAYAFRIAKGVGKWSRRG